MSHTAVEHFTNKQGFRMTSPMGWRNCPMDTCKPKPWSKCPVCNGTGQSYHGGVDFGDRPCGHPILAPWPGIVTESAWYTGWGNTFAMDIGPGSGQIMLTAHHHSLRVPRGRLLREGDMIAVNGTTGTSTGCHVHLEIRKNDGSRIGSRDRQDPELWRLKPVAPSTKFKAGDWVTNTDRLNLRSMPGLGSIILATMEPGAVGQVLADPDNGKHVSGYHWWRVMMTAAGGMMASGWMAEGYLALTAEPPKPEPKPEPQPDPEPEPQKPPNKPGGGGGGQYLR